MASTLLSEFAPAHRRGAMVVLLESFWAYGSVLAALVAYLVIPRWGWQAAFLITPSPAAGRCARLILLTCWQMPSA